MAEKRIETKRLEADASGVSYAADILRAGGLVAFPTETVYGLGADATNGQAVAGIFEAKGRPSFNPLIVHVSGLEMAERYGVFSDVARAFVEMAWPDAVSVVVPLRPNSGLSELVTAGQNSVALRMPRSDIALELLRTFGGPVAAPSANLSGKISPTSADHVLKGLDGRIDAVIDGGPTPQGLESTIIGFLEDPPVLYREGAFVDVPPEMVRKLDGESVPVTPGQLASHYAPKASLRLNATEARGGEMLIGFGDVAGDLSLSLSGDLREAAANLYALLHVADERDVERVAVAPIPNEGLGRAINDRLHRAAAPRS